jgi:hypothetical protein
MPDWHNPHYLQSGTSRQRQAYQAWRALGLGVVLHDFGPLITGTIPLDIDVAGSDLDVCCEVALAAQDAFEALVRRHYGHLPAFRVSRIASRGHAAIVCGFSYEGLPVEVFGQALPTMQQYAFRHLVVEAAILEAGGEPWRTAVRQLKQRGLKTEPAFAQLLHLPSDPYEALLTLEGWSMAQLRAYLAQCPLRSAL